MANKKRIWELDAFRGLCILGVIIVHTIYDLQMFGMMTTDTPTFFNIIRDYGSLLFIVMSGICVTLGRHNLKRGIIVFLCGMVITGVTYGMYFLELALYKHLPTWAIAIIGIVIILMGFATKSMISDSFWTVPFGILSRGYMASDYFPIVPNLGWFMVGTVLGRTVYDKKESLLPNVPHKNAPARFLRFCGRHSLWIYLGHQPIIYGAVYLFYTFSNK